MKPSLFAVKKIGAIFTLLMAALPAGCIPLSNGGRSGPPVGVVELDQNTDPRFFIRDQAGEIGRLKVAGNDVWLNGKRVARDIDIPNGSHVRTGPASAAIIQFSPAVGIDCGLEVRDFRHGRIYGSAKQCGHMVSTNQGVMETPGAEASYHVEARDDGETVFTAIKGQASVWRHANPSDVRRVPGYHQVVLSRDGISPPRRVTPKEVEEMTSWRKNFLRYEKSSSPVDQDLIKSIFDIFNISIGVGRKEPRGDVKQRVPESSSSDDRQSPTENTETSPAETQPRGDGTTVNPGRVIRTKPSVLDQKPIRRVPSEEPGQLR